MTNHDLCETINESVRSGNLLTTQELLESGVNVNTANRNGDTLLHMAALRGNMPMVELLLRHEANASATSVDGLSPRDVAAKFGNQNIVSLLSQKIV